MDVVFAVDSIPAVIAITDDSFLVFTSNVFAILSLRSLFFAVVIVLEKFQHMTKALVLVLGFVGIKIILKAAGIEIGSLVSLAAILGLLAAGMLASVVRRP
jgi:tellurite resistance protein TerC